MANEAGRRAAEAVMREQYARALHLADAVWRSENDGVLNQDRLKYLQSQYVGAVFVDYVDTAIARAVAERDEEWMKHVEYRVARAVKGERERCAKLVETWHAQPTGEDDVPGFRTYMAAALRAPGEKA